MAEQHPVPKMIGRYQVLGTIGIGAMGAVYKAFDPLIKRTLAIKTIRLDIARGSPEYKQFLDRFYHEARISGTLAHPSIVTLFDIGEDVAGLPYLAMEFIEGQTLEHMIERGVRFRPEKVINLASQIAAALDYAHQRGVVHRDVKPSNLILFEQDRVKVMDFGIAKLAGSEMTQAGQLLGTPSYMSPEQALGEKLDGRSDIFSLGVVCFEMLSGEQPFHGNNVTSILYRLVHLAPAEPKNLELSGLVPQKWHEVFTRVLAKKPEQRYQTAAEFVQDLELCLGSWFSALPGGIDELEDPGERTMLDDEGFGDALPESDPGAGDGRPAGKAPHSNQSTAELETRRAPIPPPLPPPVPPPSGRTEPLPATDDADATFQGDRPNAFTAPMPRVLARATDPSTAPFTPPAPPLRPEPPLLPPLPSLHGVAHAVEPAPHTVTLRTPAMSEGADDADDADDDAAERTVIDHAEPAPLTVAIPAAPGATPSHAPAPAGATAAMPAAGEEVVDPAEATVAMPAAMAQSALAPGDPSTGLEAERTAGKVGEDDLTIITTGRSLTRLIPQPPGVSAPGPVPPQSTPIPLGPSVNALRIQTPVPVSAPSPETPGDSPEAAPPPLREPPLPPSPPMRIAVVPPPPAAVPPPPSLPASALGTAPTAPKLHERPSPPPPAARSSPRLPRPSAGRPSGSNRGLLLAAAGGFMSTAIAIGVLFALRGSMAPAPPPSTLPPLTSGLRVDSRPEGAAVRVNGEVKGTTPLVLPGLPHGLYDVEIELAGHETARESVALTQAAPARALSLVLGPASNVRSTGVLDVTSQPSGAEVQVDGVAVGTTPLRGFRLPAGSHRVSLSAPDFEPSERQIEVDAGEREQLSIALGSNRIYENTELDSRPERVNAPSPKLPPQLEERFVYAVLTVGLDGRVESVEVKESAGRALDDTVRQTVKGWRFEPGRKNGAAVRFREHIRFRVPVL